MANLNARIAAARAGRYLGKTQTKSFTPPKCGNLMLLVLFTGLSGRATAQPAPTADESQQLRQALETLQLQVALMKSQYEERILKLEEKLAQLEKAQAETQAEFQPVGSTEPEPETPAKNVTFSGGESTLQRLNPEISVTGDVTARFSDNHRDADFNRLNFDGFELAVQHPLDPFSQAKFFLTFEDGEVDLEEGYLSWESLPGSLGVKVGRFHTNFGKLNRYHKHALPWADRDLPTRTLFGDEGLIGDGISVSWLPPKLPWTQTAELYFDVFNNSNDRVFSGRGFGDPVFLGRLLNYYDVTDDAYFEWGISAATSHLDLEKTKRSTVYGLDLSYRWQPARRAIYRSAELRGEFFYNDRQDSPGGNPFGFYLSGEYQLGRRWFAGLRYQYAETLEDSGRHISSFSPFLTFWQSEWARLRAQYDFKDPNFEDSENRLFFQFTWALGPHKHEAY